MKKKDSGNNTYIKTTAYVEATRRYVRMFLLKNMGREITVTVRDREVRRDRSIFARLIRVQFYGTTLFSPQLIPKHVFHLIKWFKLNINQNNVN